MTDHKSPKLLECRPFSRMARLLRVVVLVVSLAADAAADARLVADVPRELAHEVRARELALLQQDPAPVRRRGAHEAQRGLGVDAVGPRDDEADALGPREGLERKVARVRNLPLRLQTPPRALPRMHRSRPKPAL